MLTYEMPNEWEPNFTADELECQFEGFNSWIDRVDYENRLFDSIRKTGMEVLNNDR